MYYTYLKTNPQGVILAVRKNSNITMPSDYNLMLEDSELSNKLLNSANEYYVDAGQVVEKPKVIISSDKDSIAFDGVDTATITIAGVPDSYSTIKVRTGSAVQDVPRGETLEISTTQAGVIEIELLEDRLSANSISIRTEEI